jgi:hypothetical protein
MIGTKPKLSQEEKRKKLEARNKAKRAESRKFRQKIKKAGFATTPSNIGGGSAKVQRLFRFFKRYTGFPVARSKEKWKGLNHKQRHTVRTNMLLKCHEIIKARLEKEDKRNSV